ncbi:hypothetical protein GQ53DRAFT_853646 [Thozetella sp. PMI_491]|nr:hypothetical protein GQ53DRAFT_853646 [Thozetella sp. PMI_491]
MRFLCFHGRGTNAKAFESQTAAIRYELGDGHSYEFVEGTVPAELAPELKDTATGDFATLFYCKELEPASVLQALSWLDDYVEAEGPFDGVMAFSLGASFVGTWMLDRAARGEPVPFSCAVFFSSARPGDAAAMRQGRHSELRAGDAPTPFIAVSTAHVWGAHDDIATGMSAEMADLCTPANRAVFVHDGGHEVPAGGDEVILAVNAIRRCISLAQIA